MHRCTQGYGHLVRILPFAALLCAGACLSTEGYYRYQDAGPAGTAGAGTPGTAGATGAAGSGPGAAGNGAAAGSGGSSGGSAAGAGGGAGTVAAGRGGTTGTAGSGGATGGTTARGGTTGSAGSTGRGGTTGSAGTTGGGVLFMDDFETGTDGWDFTLSTTTPSVVTDGSTKVLGMTESAGDQLLAAAGNPAWTNFSVEAKVKVIGFTGTSSSDGVAICARLTGAESFYYFAIQANDMKGKIKINNGGNSSLSSSFDAGFAMNTWQTMRLDVQGNTLTAYVNGAMKSTYTVPASDTDHILTAGGTGFMIQRATAQFDDIVVRSLP